MQPSAALDIVNDITANDSLLLWLYCKATFYKNNSLCGIHKKIFWRTLMLLFSN